MTAYLFIGAITLLAVGITGALILPLLKPSAKSTDQDARLHIYKQQLKEVDRDLAAGMIGPVEAEAARTEISRRLLAADQARGSGSPSSQRSPFLALWLAVTVPLSALALYAFLGNPGTPDQPHKTSSGRMDNVLSELDQANLRLAVETNRKKLLDNPNDISAWLGLAKALQAQGRSADAVDALSKALIVSNGDPNIRGIYGEALMLAANGAVTKESREAFTGVLAERPSDPRARYFLSLGDWQDGKHREALTAWSKLAAEAKAEDSWVGLVRERITLAAREIGEDPDKYLPRLPEEFAGSGPSNDDLAMANRMGVAGREAAIRAMVDGLAARLEKEPNDPAGWQRLARSYSVLGDSEKEIAALQGWAKADPRAVEPRLILAQRFSATRRDETIALLRDILLLDPNRPEALWGLAGFAATGGDKAEARSLLKHLLEVLPPTAPERPMVENALKSLGP